MHRLDHPNQDLLSLRVRPIVQHVTEEVDLRALDRLRLEEVVGHGFDAIAARRVRDRQREVLENDAALQVWVFGAEGATHLAAATANIDEEGCVRRFGLEQGGDFVLEGEDLDACFGHAVGGHEFVEDGVVLGVFSHPVEAVEWGLEGELVNGFGALGGVLVGCLGEKAREIDEKGEGAGEASGLMVSTGQVKLWGEWSYACPRSASLLGAARE